MSIPNKKRLCVAIDGPAGAGKSTVAKALAARLGYTLLDTGALYRVVALAAQREGVSWEDEERVGKIAHQLAAESAIELKSTSDAAGTSASLVTQVFLRGEDVSLAIRAPNMSMGASRVSAIGAVRAALLEMQRSDAREGGVVLEGRDIGTVVLPNAEVKFFLTASPETRAERRTRELAGRGERADFQATLDEVNRRDKADTERSIAPLKQADDATVIDSSQLTAEDVVDEMVRIVSARV